MEWILTCGATVLIDEEDYNKIDKKVGIYLMKTIKQIKEKPDM